MEIIAEYLLFLDLLTIIFAVMEKVERFKQAFDYIKGQGYIHTQKDVANKMAAGEGSISKALKGDDATLTDRFLQRFNSAFGSVFNIDWLLYGEGDMLSGGVRQNVNGSNNHVAGRDINISSEDFSKLIDTVNKQQEQMGRLITLLENKNK